jgi:tetratricopeptide (TPR) repeat protein
MEVSVLNSNVPASREHPIGPNSQKIQMTQAAVRRNVFRFLLDGAAAKGSRIVDLGAGHCLFAKFARDQGHDVTAVDARTERKPSDEELGSIKFVQSDVREFDISGFDFVVLLGLLYHLDVHDQLAILKKCARLGVPTMLETQVHFDTLVPEAQTGDWARKIVDREGYEGVVFSEGDNPMASVGNSESFWPTEPSLLRMFEDAGFRKVSIVDPIFLSKYGARRYYLLNCENFAPNVESAQNLAASAQRAKFVELVRQNRFDAALEMSRSLALQPVSIADWRFVTADAQMRFHFGESELALAKLRELRDLTANGGGMSALALMRLAEFFDKANAPGEAGKTKALAYERLGTPAQLKSFIQASTALDARGEVRDALAYVEERFSGNLELLKLAAQTYYAMGDFEAVARTARQGLERDPQNLDMLTQLAYALLRLEKRDEAEPVLRQALTLDPRNARILEKLAAVNLAVKRYDEAESNARGLISVAPLDAKGYFLMALSLRARRRRAEALDYARRAAELEPGNARYRDAVAELSKPDRAVRTKAE